MRAGQAGDLLGERHRRAARIAAAETPHPQRDHDLHATRRGVPQLTHITAMDPPGRLTAPPARRCPRPDPGVDSHPARKPVNPFNPNGGKVRQQLLDDRRPEHDHRAFTAKPGHPRHKISDRTYLPDGRHDQGPLPSTASLNRSQQRGLTRWWRAKR